MFLGFLFTTCQQEAKMGKAVGNMHIEDCTAQVVLNASVSTAARSKNGESCGEHAYRGLYCTSGTECLSQYSSKKQKWGKLWGTYMVRKVFY